MSGGASTDGPGGAAVPSSIALSIALGVLVAVRLAPAPRVFRGGDVVLLSNDPYAYLYLVEHALAGDLGSSVANGEPLLVWTLAGGAALLGGLPRVPLVLAWYPVVSAVCTGLLVFRLARLLTNDVRVGVAAVAVLAVTPLHASRTGLGFADHHAFDSLWLAITVTSLAWLVVRTGSTERRRWTVGGVLALGVAGQTLAWEASPLLLVPAGVAVGTASLVVLRHDDPTATLAPVVGGFGLAAAVVLGAHWTLGWQGRIVALAPAVLALGATAVLGLTAGVDRVGRSWPTLLGAGVLTAAVGGTLGWLTVPGITAGVAGRIGAFGEYVRLYGGTEIGETKALTAAFGPVAGPIVLLGFALFLGVPAAAWGLRRAWTRTEPGWIVAATYVAWFLVLVFLQRRFAVHLAIPLSVFAGFGFVTLGSWLALLRPPNPLRANPDTDQRTLELPDRRRLAILGGMGVVGVGSGSLFSGTILLQVATDRATYRAAAWIEEYADDRGLTYPRNYVLAQWDNVRVYNYFVSGESRSYAYARETYSDFLFSTDADRWYDEFEGRVGFVVTRTVDASSYRVQSQLHDRYGSAGEATDGVGHYRALWESADGSKKVFGVVPGATVGGRATPGTEVTLSTTVRLAGSGESITYRRRARADPDGRFAVVLAHPGTYTLRPGGRTVTVEESDVLAGATTTVRYHSRDSSDRA